MIITVTFLVFFGLLNCLHSEDIADIALCANIMNVLSAVPLRSFDRMQTESIYVCVSFVYAAM